MSAIINGDSPSVTFSDGTTQATSAIVGGKVPYTNLPAGSVLQVVSAVYGTQTSTTSSTYGDTGLTATITPKFSTSKILIIHNLQGILANSNSGYMYALQQMLRNGSSIFIYDQISGYASANTGSAWQSGTHNTVVYLDSPASTSALTYKSQIKINNGASGTLYWNNNANTSTITLMEIAG